MQFFVEQIAIKPRDPEAARNLLGALGALNWSVDNVLASGEVFGQPAENEAVLSFNYELGRSDGKPLEFEILEYVDGDNWIDNAPGKGTDYGKAHNLVSHLGMHVTEEQLLEVRKLFIKRKICVAQEVTTVNHTNPVIAGKRWYNYVIFDTRAILGVDLKFIVRKDINPRKPAG